MSEQTLMGLDVARIERDQVQRNSDRKRRENRRSRAEYLLRSYYEPTAGLLLIKHRKPLGLLGL